MVEQIVRADSLGELLFLGGAGENLRHKIVFDCAPLAEEFHGGVAELLVKPPDSDVLYPPATTQHDRLLEWVITNNDTAASGKGKAELRWYGQDGELAKSVVFWTMVRKSLTNEGTVPDYYKGWVDRVVEAGARAKQDANAAQASAEAAAESQSVAASSAQSAAESAASAQQSKEASEASERNTQELTEEVRASLEAVTQAKNEVGTLAEGVRQDKNDVNVAHNYVMDTANELYDGVDLSEVFADEIKDFSSVWAWMQDRINRGDFTGFHVCDYIPFVIGPYPVFDCDGTHLEDESRERKAIIMGIDTFRTDKAHHIDFVFGGFCISFSGDRTPYAANVMNFIDYNNGIPGGTGVPWLDSNLYLWMNSKSGNVIESCSVDEETGIATRTLKAVDYSEEGVLNRLPQALRDHIVERKTWMSVRFDADKLVDVTSQKVYTSIGKLWLPSEFEVFGIMHYAASSGDVRQGVQYPFFKLMRNRARFHEFFTRSPHWGGQGRFASLIEMGYPYVMEASINFGGEIACFRMEGRNG